MRFAVIVVTLLWWVMLPPALVRAHELIECIDSPRAEASIPLGARSVATHANRGSTFWLAVQSLHPDALTSSERSLLELLNASRGEEGLPALRSDRILMQLARDHSLNMARLEQLSHELERRTFQDRLESSGYKAQAAGENCAEGALTPADAIDGWLKSPGHRANIMSEDYTDIGIGLATSREGVRYYTLVFAKPASRSE